MLSATILILYSTLSTRNFFFFGYIKYQSIPEQGIYYSYKTNQRSRSDKYVNFKYPRRQTDNESRLQKFVASEEYLVYSVD